MQITDELPLTCRIELWLSFAHVGHTADDIFRSVRFRYESFRARFDGAFHRVVWTQRRQNKHMRRIGKHAELTSGFNAIHAGHGDISQHDIRRIVRRMFDGVCCVGAGEGNADASGGIILQNQTHHLADHRIIINHADGDRLLVMAAFGAHPTHGSRTSRWKTLCWSKPYWHVPPACCMRLAKPGRPAPFLVSAICEGDCGIVGLLTCTCTPCGGFASTCNDTGAPGACLRTLVNPSCTT